MSVVRKMVCDGKECPPENEAIAITIMEQNPTHTIVTLHACASCRIRLKEYITNNFNVEIRK